MKYYRKLGIGRFFIIDNGSSDGSTEFLSSQTDVQLFKTNDSFAKHRHGTNWLQALLQIYGVGHWCLTVDVDELLVFPGSEELSLQDLSTFMEQEKAQALFAMMIDMYPSGESAKREYKIGEPFLTAADHFDLGPYYVSIKPGRMFPPIKIRGGFQHRILQQENPKLKGPLLKKVPFVKWSSGTLYGGSAHSIAPSTPLSRITGALLHFKYLHSNSINNNDEFVHQRRSKAENQRTSTLREILHKDNVNNFADSKALNYKNSIQLNELGFVSCHSSWHPKSTNSHKSHSLAKILHEHIFPNR